MPRSARNRITRATILRASTVLAAALLAVTGCGSTPRYTPLPTTTAPAPSNTSVPPIPAPLDGNRFIDDPCTAVTVEQVASIGFAKDGRKETSPPGQCMLGFGGMVEVNAYWYTPNRESLGTLYDNHAKSKDTGNRWEETSVNGYPAVVIWAEGNFGCRLALGVDPATTVYLLVKTHGHENAGPWRDDPCGAAKKVAEFVVTNLAR